MDGNGDGNEDGIGEGRGEAKKRKKPHKSCRGHQALYFRTRHHLCRQGMALAGTRQLCSQGLVSVHALCTEGITRIGPLKWAPMIPITKTFDETRQRGHTPFTVLMFVLSALRLCVCVCVCVD